MTTATQVINDTYAELYRPQTARQRMNNPVPTPDQIRAALRHFEQPAELRNTRIESWLINMRMIERFITPRQKTAARKTGLYARKYYVMSVRGYMFMRPVQECRALVPYEDAPRQFAARYIQRFILEAYVPLLDYDALIAAMSLHKVEECPF